MTLMKRLSANLTLLAAGLLVALGLAWGGSVGAQDTGATPDDATAQTGEQATAADGESASTEAPAATTEEAAPAEDVESEAVRAEIEAINLSVSEKKKEMERINSSIDHYRNEVMRRQIEAQSLSDQMSLIDNRIAKEQLAIDIAKSEVRSLELEISVLNRQIAERETQIAEERTTLAAMARKLYRMRFGRSLFEILLSHKSFSDFFDTLHQMSRLELAVDEALIQLQSTRRELETEKTDREDKRAQALERKSGLEAAKLQLEDEKVLKDDILTVTRSSEQEFRYLIAELKNEQSEADSEIIYLEKRLRQKLDLADRLKGQNTVLSWPLVAARGISANFHDPDYPFRYVYEHPGVDIRAGQGTPVRAAAAGIVARAKNAGMGYSYVMLLHNGNIATVYGHLSRLTAKEDSFVERGEVIGYSGGMPGTPGAGRMTTGPHLHFETRLDGIPVDPMKYLVSL